MTFNADGNFNLIADLSNACCWISQTKAQYMQAQKLKKHFCWLYNVNGMAATTTSTNMISHILICMKSCR
jgi:hypothetical protein